MSNDKQCMCHYKEKHMTSFIYSKLNNKASKNTSLIVAQQQPVCIHVYSSVYNSECIIYKCNTNRNKYLQTFFFANQQKQSKILRGKKSQKILRTSKPKLILQISTDFKHCTKQTRLTGSEAMAQNFCIWKPAVGMSIHYPHMLC